MTSRSHIGVAVLAFCLLFGATHPTLKAQTFSPVAWPNESQWKAYRVKDTTINDHSVQDPSNGGTSPQLYVNISSGVPDRSVPSAYYALTSNTIFIRFRLEGSPNAYTPGHAGRNSDPWKSAQWTMMLDLNGDGWRDFAIFLDGASGIPSAPLDRIKIIYSRLTTTQSIDYGTPGIYLIGEIYAAQTYTSGPNIDQIQRFDGNGNLITTTNPWSEVTTVYDYGTTRVIDKTAENGQYFLDFQLQMSALDARGWNGPQITTSTLMSGAFSTANSLNDPFQKDFAYNGEFCANPSNPMPGGDPMTFNGGDLPKLIITSITAAFCPTVTLTTSILTAQRLLDCYTVVSSVVTTNFYYWFDSNANGLSDEAGGQWILIGAGTPTTLGVWQTNWNTTSLPKGQYLIKVVGIDQYGYSADSYTQTIPQYPNVYAVVNNNCGILPGQLSKTVNKSAIVSNQPDDGRKVIYTITVANPQSGAITLDTLSDQLPSTFSYVKDTTGGALVPTSSPTLGATGTINWIFNPAESIPAGGSKTLKFIALGGTTPGTYTNSVFAKGSTYYSSATNVAPIVITNASASVSKTTSALAGLQQGQTYSYTIYYQNTGSVPLTNVVLTDSLVQGIRIFISASGGGIFDSVTSKVTWNLGTLAAGASGSQTITIGISNPYSGTNPLTNSAYLNSNELIERVYSNVVTNTVIGAVLSMTKSVSPTHAYPGNNVTYTILYGNVGTAAATGVVISDTLPANLTYVSGTSSPLSPSITTVGGRQVLTYSVGSIEAGGGNLNNTITFQASIVNPYPTVGANQVANNVVVISSNETAPYYYIEPLYITAIPGVSNSKTSNQSVYAAGDSATFTFTLTNDGYFNATLDTLEDDLPNGFAYGWTSGGNLSPSSKPTTGATGTIRWIFSPAVSISPGQTKTLIFRVKCPNVGVNYTNVGRARGVLTSASQGSVSSSLPITIAEGEEALNKSVNKTAAFVGDTLIYTLYYLNGAGAQRNNRQICDTLPTSLNFLSQSSSNSGGGTVDFTNSGQALQWTINTNPNGNSCTITIRALINQSNTTVVNKSFIMSSPVKESNIVTTISSTPPNMTFTKSVNLTSAPVNTELTYTISYSNSPGVSASTNTVIIDTIPSYLSYVPGSVTGGGAFEGTPSPKGRLVWSLGTVSANSTGSVSFRATIDGSTPVNTVITNTARLSNEEGTSKSSSVNDTVRALPNFSFTKSVNIQTAGPADTLIYIIKYKNTGQASATNVSIVDTIPANTYYVSASSGGSYESGLVTWTIGTLAVNDSGQVTLSVRLPKPMAYNSVSQIGNRAALSCSEVATRISNNALTNVIYPLIYPVKSVDSTLIYAGNIMKYTIVVSNATISASTATILQDSIPSRTAYIANSTTLNSSPVNDTAGTSPLVYGLSLGTITPTTPVTVTFQVRINTPISNGMVVSNRAKVSTDKLTSPIYGNTVQSTVISSPRLTLTKIVAGTDTIPGTTLTFTLRYGNPGTDTAYNFGITDTIPSNANYVSGSVSGTGASFDATGNRIVVSRSYLAANDTGNIASFQVQVANPLPSGRTYIRNRATASASNATSVIDSAWTYVTAVSTMNLDKSGPATGMLLGSPTPADTITYTINYSITGTAIVDSVRIIDTLQTGLSYLSSTLNGVSGGTANGQVVSWYLGTLNPGASGQATVTVRTTTPSTYRNFSHIASMQEPEDARSDTVTTIVTLPHTGTISQTATIYPSQTITITVVDPDLFGQGLIFVTARNLRTGESEQVGLTEVSGDTGKFTGTISTVFGTSSNGNNNGSFAVQAEDTVKSEYYDGVNADGEADTLYAQTRVIGGFTATITATPSLVAAGNNVTFSFTDQDLNRSTSVQESYVIQTHSSTGEIENLTFTETEVNTGIFSITVPTVYDTSVGANNNGSFNVEPGDTLTATYQDTLTASGSSATISASSIVGSVNFSGSSKSLVDLNGGSPMPPDTLSFTIKVKNSGTVGATSVSIIDSLPEGITVVAGSITPGGSVANRVITFTTFNLASNDSTLLTYKLTIDSSIQNGVLHTNIATITANGARTQVTASFTPVNRPFMTITKNVNAPSAKPSDTLTYTATYTNNGTAVATVVIVTDAVPQYTTYVLQSVILNNVSKSDESDGDEVVVSGGIITINVGTVSPGQTGTIKYKVKIN